ncbi:MAG: hypothetical protein ABH858_06270 [Candidatus Omnitrophota bacterium]
MIIGCLIHPNNPNNWLSLYLNGILVPILSIIQVRIDFGSEFNTNKTLTVLISNFAVFFLLNTVFWTTIYARVKLSFSSFV